MGLFCYLVLGKYGGFYMVIVQGFHGRHHPQNLQDGACEIRTQDEHSLTTRPSCHCSGTLKCSGKGLYIIFCHEFS